jgi:pyruvate formate lyase activating enzyme
MNIHSIETFGTHEGPGIRFVIFTQGCNYKCLYCHNPDSQSLTRQVKSQKSKVESHGNYSIDELINMIEKNLPYFGEKGGVTVSGGEPLLQAKEVGELFTKLKEMNINTALDTNGSILNNDVKELLKYADLVLLDIKHIDPMQHRVIINCQLPISNQISSTKIPIPELPTPNSQLQNDEFARDDNEDAPVPSITFADYLESQQIPFWIRYVLVPGYTDQPEFLEKTAEALRKYKSLERIEILPYHTMGAEKYEKLGWEYKLNGVEPPSAEKLDSAKAILTKSGKLVIIR